jgi:SPP1 gp7 family putative phage head morphogenesis protein
VDELADEIADLIGDPARAETIARTEVQRASNQGQIEAWDQATDEGLLTGTETKEWIVTPDDRLCPICEPLDGQNVPMDGTFDADGAQVDGPPAHPNCRCTLGISLR